MSDDLGKIYSAECEGRYLLRFTGDVRLNLSIDLDAFMTNMLNDKHFKSVTIDLLEAECIDSTCLGLLAKLAIQTQKDFDFTPKLFVHSTDLITIIERMGLNDLFCLETNLDYSNLYRTKLKQLFCEEDCDETQLKHHVVTAHQVLSSINEANKAEFAQLLDSLVSQAS